LYIERRSVMKASSKLVRIIGSALRAVERKREAPVDDLALRELKHSVARSLAELEVLKTPDTPATEVPPIPKPDSAGRKKAA
jgi:hypothetical protein